MKVKDDTGRVLDATFSVELGVSGVEVVFESRGGARGGLGTRNIQYAEGLEILLRRLAGAGAFLVDARVDSAVARRLPIAERRLLPASEFPLDLARAPDLRALRHRLGQASAAVGRAPAATGGGNPTKRLRLVVEWPAVTGLGVERIERDLSGPSAAAQIDEGWSQTELAACVTAYKTLWDAQVRGEGLNKAQLRRQVLARQLPTRSEGSYEFRMQNISAVLDELGMKRVDGYLPRRNIGALKPAIVRLINEAWRRETISESATADPDALATRVVAARAKLRARRGAQAPPKGRRSPIQQVVGVARFPRDPEVIAWVLEQAGGRCEVCEEPAPFLRGDGEPFLEVHHVRPLAEGGPDTTDNAVGCCPNCHRKLHYSGDRLAIRRRLIGSILRLKDHPKAPAFPDARQGEIN